MSTTPLLNQAPNEFSLADVLKLLKKEIFLDLQCHHLGTIESFNPTNQTAVVTINYQKTLFKQDPKTFNYIPYTQPYPTLLDCPVVILGGGKGQLTFPIAPGDQCLALFNDRDLDNWFQGANGGPVNSNRLHSFSDAIILVGLYPTTKSIASYDTTRAVLRNDKAIFGVGPALFKMENDTKNLKTILTQLITDLQTLCTNINAIVTTNTIPGSPAAISPASQAAISSVSSSLSTVASDLAGLLE